MTNAPPYYDHHPGRAMSLVRFVFTVISLCLLIPMAYLMRIQAWAGRLTSRARRLVGATEARPGPSRDLIRRHPLGPK